jgi:flagellar protein FliJ
MTQFDQLVRLRTWELDEKRRELGELQTEADAAHARRAALEDEVKAEQRIAAESFETGFNYSAYANQVIRRRAELDRAIEDAEALVEAKAEEVAVSYGELRKAEIVRDRYEERERIRLARIEQAGLDEIAQQQHAQKQR